MTFNRLNNRNKFRLHQKYSCNKNNHLNSKNFSHCYTVLIGYLVTWSVGRLVGWYISIHYSILHFSFKAFSVNYNSLNSSRPLCPYLSSLALLISNLSLAASITITLLQHPSYLHAPFQILTILHKRTILRKIELY